MSLMAHALHIQGPHIVVIEGRAAVQHGVVVQELDVPGLQVHVHAQLIAAGQRVEEPQRLLLLLCQARHLHGVLVFKGVLTTQRWRALCCRADQALNIVCRCLQAPGPMLLKLHAVILQSTLPENKGRCSSSLCAC